jgi:hypothetical protein
MKNQEKKPKNPSAYPSWDMTFNENPNTNLFSAGTSQGMSLRDKFANSAVQAFINRSKLDTISKGSAELFAKRAFIVADAMLKQREL